MVPDYVCLGFGIAKGMDIIIDSEQWQRKLLYCVMNGPLPSQHRE